jgi:G3E family GTPase
VANPAPIISTFLLDPSLQRCIRMDGICTVVDSKHVTGHLDRKEETGVENEACAQLAYADRIVINKVDLVSKGELSALRERVQAINNLATMQEAERSVVPIDYVLGIGGYALSEVSNQVHSFL